MKHLIKRWIAFLACFALLLGVMPVPALATATSAVTPIEPVTATYINPLYADEMTESDLNQPGIALADVGEYYTTTQAAGVAVREQLKARAETIVVGLQAESMETQQMHDIMDAAMEHTGVSTEGDYLKWQYGGWQCSMGGYTSGGSYYLTLTYTMTYYTTAAQEAELDTAVNALLSELDLSGKSDYEKVKGIYDYICDNVTYDYSNLNDDTYKLKYTAYAALVNKTAVCQGYALLLYRLVLELGVDCRFISGTGNGGAHGWNIIGLDGLYYNADATWDAVRSSYSYFLVSDGNFINHVRGTDYSSDAFYAAYPMGTENYDPNAAISTVTSGTCGENLTWEFDEATGTLTISGTGDMYDYGEDLAELPWSPWFDLCTSMKTVIINPGVTRIGNFAFFDHLNDEYAITSITIPDSVTSIGESAFNGLSKLTSITIPESVTEIEEQAFRRCSSLESIALPNGLTKINVEEFRDCTGLTSVIIPNSVTSIEHNAFDSCESLISVTIPNSVTSIDRSAFIFCTDLTSIIILNPKCEIGSEMGERIWDHWNDTTVPSIYGYAGSTAETYAVTYGHPFVIIYGIIEGANSQWYAEDGGTLRVQADADKEKLVSITVDGELVDSSNYDVTEDSAIVTFHEDYLKTLSEGEHILRINFTDGVAETSFTIQSGAAPAVTFRTASLSLAGDIGINFYVALSDSVLNNPDARMVFTYGNSKTQIVPVSQAKVSTDASGNVSYRFSCKVSAKEMADIITAQMYLGDEPVGPYLDYSVRGYYNNTVKYVTENNLTGYESLITMLKAMLNYGAQSQILFGYNTDDLANSTLEEADKQLPGTVDVSGYAMSYAGSEEGITLSSASLMLESTTAIRIYFQLTGEKTMDDYTFYVDGEEVTPVLGSNGQYYVEIPDIAAKNLDVMYTVSVGGLSIQYSGLSYVNMVQNWSGSTESLLNTAKAIYVYNQTANAYFGA